MSSSDPPAAQLVLAHGWAMDHHFFDPLVDWLTQNSLSQNRSTQITYSSREYYAASKQSPAANIRGLSSLSPWIGIGHSFGFMRLAGGDLSNCRGLISLCGFTEFCGEGGTPVRLVERMLKKLAQDPQAVIERFLQRSGAENLQPAGTPQLEDLTTDLQQLIDKRIGHDELAGVPVLALAAADDPVVPLSLSRRQFGNLVVAPGGQHVLGNQFEAWCGAHIHDFLASCM